MITEDTDQPTSVFIKPKASNAEQSALDGFRVGAAVDKRVLLLNNLGKDVTVLERNELEYKIGSLNTPNYPRGFIIRTEYRFSSEVFKKLEKYLHSPDNDYNDALRVIRENLVIPPFRRKDNSERLCIIDYIIDNDVILKNGDRLYIDDLDLAIGIGDYEEELIHPYSAKGRAMQMGIYLNWGQQSIGAGIDLVYVPALPNYPGLFAKIANRVIYIPPTVNPNLESGLHVSYTSTVEGENDKPKKVKSIISQLEWKEHGIYRTYDEAVVGADFEAAHKLALAEATRKYEKLKSENLDFEARLKKQLIELEMMKAKVKGEQIETASHFGKKDLRRKNKYGKKAAKRDNRSAIIKNMPALIIGVAAVTMAIRKLFA